MMKKTLMIFVWIFLIMASGCSRSAETNNFKSVEAEDKDMNAAITKAKETSADFIRAFHEHKAGTSDFYVKRPFVTPSKGHEHMWISVTAENNGVITGTIANDAEETKVVKMGDVVSVKTIEISDWKYMNGNKLIGGYTIRYFINKMSPNEKEEFLKEAGFEL